MESQTSYTHYQTSIPNTNLTYHNINKCAYFNHKEDYTCSLLFFVVPFLLLYIIIRMGKRCTAVIMNDKERC